MSGSAMSQTKQNLFILNFNDAKISVDPRVVEEMECLCSSVALPLCWPSLHTLPGFKVVFHNARSLCLHMPDLQAEKFWFIVESRLMQSDQDADYQLHPLKMTCFDSMHTHAAGVRPSYGTVLYSKTIMQNVRHLDLFGIQTTVCFDRFTPSL